MSGMSTWESARAEQGVSRIAQVLGLPVINGWGLTETSPVLSCRPVWPRENVRGTVGLPMAGTQVRVVDPETLQPLPEGAKVGFSRPRRCAAP